MSNIDLQEILSNFEKTIGYKLDFSEDNTAELIFNQTMVIGMRFSEEDCTIIFSSVIANDLPDPISNDLFLDILAINAAPAGGNAPVIARDPKTGFIFVYEILTASILQIKALFTLFSDFVSYALELREHITQNTIVKKEEHLLENAIIV